MISNQVTSDCNVHWLIDARCVRSYTTPFCIVGLTKAHLIKAAVQGRARHFEHREHTTIHMYCIWTPIETRSKLSLWPAWSKSLALMTCDEGKSPSWLHIIDIFCHEATSAATATASPGKHIWVAGIVGTAHGASHFIVLFHVANSKNAGRSSGCHWRIEAAVLPRVTTKLLASPVPFSANADQRFRVLDSFGILLGADSCVMLHSQQQDLPESLSLLTTHFDWVIMGIVNPKQHRCHHKSVYCWSLSRAFFLRSKAKLTWLAGCSAVSGYYRKYSLETSISGYFHVLHPWPSDFWILPDITEYSCTRYQIFSHLDIPNIYNPPGKFISDSLRYVPVVTPIKAILYIIAVFVHVHDKAVNCHKHR